MRIIKALLSASVLFLLSSPLALSQQSQVIPQFSTVEPHEYDSINLATLGIRLNVPVRSKAGRIPFSYSLTGAAQVSFRVNRIGQGQPRSYWDASPGLAGQESGFPQQSSQGELSSTGSYPCFNNSPGSQPVFTDASGSTHTFSFILYSSSTCGATSGSGYATDNSGLFMSMDSNGNGYVSDVNGYKTIFSNSATGISDPNGNSISKGILASPATFTDTLGQTALVHTASTSGETDSWTDALGNSQSVTLTNTRLTIWTAFGCGNASEDQPSATPNFIFATSVSFPDNTALALGWEKNYSNSSAYTGRLASITLPTGGTISYAYSGGTNGVNCSDGTPAIMKRTTPDGVWTYSHTAPSSYGWSAGPAITTVTDPQGNNIVYTFTDDFYNLLTKKQVYNGTVSPANLLQTTFICYNNTSSTPTYPCSGTLGLNITQKDVYTTYTGVTGYSAVKTSIDSYGRTTDVKTYDFNASTPTNEKVIVYGTGSPSSQQCTAISSLIIGRPCTVTLLDSQHSNAILSQTWNAYDSNGNLTQTWNLVSGSGSSGTYLSKQFTYLNGVVQTATDVNGQVMNYSTTSCNNMFLTSQYPSGFSNLQTSQTWDCNGGVQTSATDANGQTTSTKFSVGTTSSDVFYRPLEKIDQLGNITSFTYATRTFESVFSFNGGSSVIDTLSTTDSIGRPIISQLKQGPGSSTWDTKSRTFDGDGRPYQSTIPCAASVGLACTTSVETQTYDGLNRPLVHTTAGEVITKTYVANDTRTTLTPAPTGEHVKATQKEYDSMGRLLSVCIISSATGSGPCGQTNGGTGFLTKYSYDAAGRLLNTVENAQVSSPRQTRSYTYDLIGRVLTETNPESGTTTNTYDSVAGTNCTSTSRGDLVQSIDANGNTSCFLYDGLHRKTRITYVGPNSNGVNKYFVYDAATVNGVAMSHTEGQMAEAYTCSGSCSSKITDEGFSYDQRGKLADYYQSSSHSGGYYHLSATSWEDGATKTVSGVGLPTITYGGLDGQGRVTTVTASSGINPVSGVTYNNGSFGSEPIGALLKTTLGTGDSQSFTYDLNTGHMTNYSASVGATPQVISGTLTWNANGTLQTNNISDAYNAADTQNCTYQYDDLMRASSVNCLNGPTTVWNQLFTFGADAFGNLTKTGTGTFLPTYSATTNHITSMPGNFIPTYDADGNLKTDSYHTYTWLPDGHVSTIDTDSITYDALGNKVEENVGGTIHEYASAFGVSAQMTGQTENSTIVGLPGGVQALYSGGTIQRFRFPDWQGTIRAEASTARVFTESLAFAPFGERYAIKGTPYNVDSFTGSPDQIVADEYDFAARELHSGAGRWISPDPMPGPGNKYAYADNDPINNVDLLGLMTMSVVESDIEIPTPGYIISDHPLIIGESGQAKSYEAAQLIQFTCGAMDCSTPSADNMWPNRDWGAEPETQTAQSEQKAEQSQNQNQQLSVSPDKKTDIKYGDKAREQNVDYNLVQTDSKGNTSPADKPTEHKVELKEKLLSGDPNKVTICTGQCITQGTLTDTMSVTAGKGHSVEKRFLVDGSETKIYDPGTKKAYDFVRVDASVKRGFVFNYGNDPN